MFKVSVMYPNQAGARFDLAYYRTTHMELVRRHMQAFGLVRTEVLKGLSGGGGQPAPYVCIGNLYFETADGYEKGVRRLGRGAAGRHRQLHRSSRRSGRSAKSWLRRGSPSALRCASRVLRRTRRLAPETCAP